MIYTLEEVSEGGCAIKDYEGSGTIRFIESTDPVIGANGEETPLWENVYNDMLKRIGIVVE